MSSINHTFQDLVKIKHISFLFLILNKIVTEDGLIHIFNNLLDFVEFVSQFVLECIIDFQVGLKYSSFLIHADESFLILQNICSYFVNNVTEFFPVVFWLAFNQLNRCWFMIINIFGDIFRNVQKCKFFL